MRIDVWSDVVCPWCYIGKRRLEKAIERFDHRGEVQVVWRAFELDRAAPRRREGSWADHLAAKYRVPPEEAEAMIAHITTVAAGEGLELRFDLACPANTFDAHRVLHLAAERGVQAAVEERFMAATFTEGAPIGDPATLVELAAAAGLDRAEVARVLEGDDYAEAVRDDEAEAATYGADAVPFFVFADTYSVSGAHPPKVLLEAMQRAWAETAGA